MRYEESPGAITLIFLIFIIFLVILPSCAFAEPGERSGNTPPEVVLAKIEPSAPFSIDNLKAVYEVYDADGDEIESIEIHWYMNGLQAPQYNGMLTIPSNDTEKDQCWHYTIRAFDGNDFSDENQSFIVMINNTPPEISKHEPIQTSPTINETESIEFSIEVDDLDEDIIIYNWYQNDVRVGDDDHYLFETDYDSAGIYVINVTIQDWGLHSVKVSMIWTVTIMNVNRAPEIQAIEPLEPHPRITSGKFLKFDINTTDEDAEDNLSIKWYFNGFETASDTTSFSFSADRTYVGDHEVEVVVSDGYVNVTHSWDLTVVKKNVIQNTFYGLNWDQVEIIISLVPVIILVIILVVIIRDKRKSVEK